MHANNSSPANKNDVGDIAVDLYPFIRKYKDGHIERLLSSSFVLASEDLAASRGVATRDVVIDQGTGVSARLFLPSLAAATGGRLPLIMYIHGGSFCTESAFCRTYHRYAASLAASAGALIVSVEYRLAPEFPIPTAYDDTWAALRWVGSFSDPWLADYADPRRTFLAGDSAGGNIVYHTAARASRDGNVIDIEGLVIVHPYFWGAERLASETVWNGVAMFSAEVVDRLWPFVTVGKAGNDDFRVNPTDDEIALLRCRRVLVAVAENDLLRDRGRQLAERMRNCAWIGGNVTLVESEGEDHGFHLYRPLRATSKKLMECIVQFINLSSTSSSPTTMLTDHGSGGKAKASTSEMAQPALSLPTRPFKTILGSGLDTKVWGSQSLMARSSLTIGRGKAFKRYHGLLLGRRRPNEANMCPLSLAVQRSFMTDF